MGKTRHWIAVAVATLAVVAVAGPDHVAGDVGCDRFAAPTGSDSGADGSITAPYRSPQRLVDSLAAEQTGCFKGGSYTFSQTLLKRPDITLAPYGSSDVALNGEIKVLPSAVGSVIEGMTLNGAAGRNQIGPRIYADRVVLRDNEITNDHTGICVHINRYFDEPPPEGVLIEGNVIHDCGQLPAMNHDHGIYIASARDTVVRDNWIYDNADRGIQQYPDTQGSRITGNVIDSNGMGVNFGGDDSGSCSNDNVVAGNVISGSRIRWNVYSGAQGPDCSGNVVRNNCVWGSNPDDHYNVRGGIEPASRSFAASGNTVAAPRFVDAGGGDYRLRSGSGCMSAYTGAMSAPSGPAVSATIANRISRSQGRRQLSSWQGEAR
jgi:hypothetical protein